MDSDIPPDALVQILLRLPPSARRRARLVCRLWRDLVGERTTEMQSRAMQDPPLERALRRRLRRRQPLLVLNAEMQGAVEEPPPPPPPRMASYEDDLQLVGSCNGLLCLCDNNGGWTGGTVTLVNPATGATLAVPPLPFGEFVGPRYRPRRWDKAYSFAYHPTTGRYKLLHASRRVRRGIEKIYAVYVLTLEEGASWREVAPSSDARTTMCRSESDAGIISVDGATYWATEGRVPRIVSFDLDDDERVRSFALPPLIQRLRIKDHSLMEVRGRLGVLARVGCGTKVWVRVEREWNLEYTLTSEWQDIPRPHFACGIKTKGSSLYEHHRKSVSSYDGRLPVPGAVVEISHRDEDRGMMIVDMKGAASDYWMFAHVEMAEPLNFYTTATTMRYDQVVQDQELWPDEGMREAWSRSPCGVWDKGLGSEGEEVEASLYDDW